MSNAVATVDSSRIDQTSIARVVQVSLTYRKTKALYGVTLDLLAGCMVGLMVIGVFLFAVALSRFRKTIGSM